MKDSSLKDLLIRDAKAGRLGRRDFMKFSVAAGMSVPLASGLWSSEVAAATPKRGGKFRVGVHDVNTSDTYDPGTYQSVGMIEVLPRMEQGPGLQIKLVGVEISGRGLDLDRLQLSQAQRIA